MEIYGMAGHLVRRLHQKSTQIFQQYSQENGIDLTSVQYAALDAIHSNPGVDQARIASLIAYDRATIGGVIDRLEAKGLVLRVVSAKDRRAREVSLTETGTALHHDITPLVRDMQDEILSGLDQEEKKNFLALAEKALTS